MLTKSVSLCGWDCSTPEGCGKEVGEALVQRARRAELFDSIHDLALRVPELRKNDLTMLAQIGALNSSGRKHSSP